MDLRPSKIGLLQIPQNPNQRGSAKEKGKRLDAENEVYAKYDLFLHPTKGFRVMTKRRIRAAILTAELKHGIARMPLNKIRRDLALAA
ncbi:MAG: hypothetical protein K5905_19075 [Roseibium sp.]|uniref:hypothetical protein n=1 Tax=Roseibium sp. TaxID=1936156 RepID=UPI0026237983|nr:hypothetical protein [Roseibium sp.]MCV0427567.1 hypothetical protein [Roseibium sp.]